MTDHKIGALSFALSLYFTEQRPVPLHAYIYFCPFDVLCLVHYARFRLRHNNSLNVTMQLTYNLHSATFCQTVCAEGNGDNSFSLTSDLCELTLTSQLDYETTTSYTLTLIASDLDPNNPLTSTMTLSVSVTDVNEYPPVSFDTVNP